MASTKEIEKAAQNLEESTLKDSLNKVQGKTVKGDKSQLVEKYQNAVVETGLKNFVGKLQAEDLKASCEAIGLTVEKDDKAMKKALEEAVLGTGISGLISKVDDKLLKSFCDTLGLEVSPKPAIEKEIADEGTFTLVFLRADVISVMLTGMEQFLNDLTSPLLKAHCSELGLDDSGGKKDMVDRYVLCVAIVSETLSQYCSRLSTLQIR
jgi:hypothetical protein